MKQIETVIIGGGQAGLSTSYFLTSYGHEHTVLDRSEKPARNWRERSWDSFTLVTPNSAFRMPGAENLSVGTNRDGFMPRDTIIRFFEEYISLYKLPVQYKTNVIAVEHNGDSGYFVQTNEQAYKAKNVVIATGFHQHPKIPAFAKNNLTAVSQVHSSNYRNPQSLPPGAVLVAGSGQSGSQIAEELYKAGRKVFLSVGTAGRAPRRYRGKDIIEWLEITGLFDLTPEQLPPGMGKFDGVPHISGANGGHTINLHRFAKDGVKLLGHLVDTSGNKIIIAPDLHETLKIVDGFELEVANMIDDYIRTNGIDAPPEELPQLYYGYEQPIIEEIDLVKEKIGTIIWATGYTFDYSLVKLPVLDQDGFPVQSRGVTAYPGLYFAGLPWMPSEKSGFLLGVGESAKYISSCIVKAMAEH